MIQVNASYLRQQLAEQIGVTPESAEAETRESLLIANGLYCGRKFTLRGYVLTWFIDEDQVKLHHPSGQLLMACNAINFCASTTNRSAA